MTISSVPPGGGGVGVAMPGAAAAGTALSTAQLALQRQGQLLAAASGGGTALMADGMEPDAALPPAFALPDAAVPLPPATGLPLPARAGVLELLSPQLRQWLQQVVPGSASTAGAATGTAGLPPGAAVGAGVGGWSSQPQLAAGTQAGGAVAQHTGPLLPPWPTQGVPPPVLAATERLLQAAWPAPVLMSGVASALGAALAFGRAAATSGPGSPAASKGKSGAGLLEGLAAPQPPVQDAVLEAAGTAPPRADGAAAGLRLLGMQPWPAPLWQALVAVADGEAEPLPPGAAPAGQAALPPLHAGWTQHAQLKTPDGLHSVLLTLRLPLAWVQQHAQALQRSGWLLPFSESPRISSAAGTGTANAGAGPLLVAPDKTLVSAGVWALVLQMADAPAVSALLWLELGPPRDWPSSYGGRDVFQPRSVSDPWLQQAQLLAAERPQRHPDPGGNAPPLCDTPGCPYQGQVACPQPFCPALAQVPATGPVPALG
jgi:hypothetical protein